MMVLFMKTRGHSNMPQTIFRLGDDSPESLYHRLFSIGQKVWPQELERLGYRLTARWVTITDHYKIFELLPLGSAHSAGFCFLSPSHRAHGVVIDNSFSEHKAAVSSIRARVALKRAIVPAPTAPFPVSAEPQAQAG